MISANGKTTLGRLSACDKFLWRGEQMVMLRFVVCVVMPLVLCIGRIWLYVSIFYCNVLILYCAAASIAWIVMDSMISRDRRTAARILQQVECDLYGTRWNEYMCGKELLPEDVYLHHRMDIDYYKGLYQDMPTQNAGFIQNIQNIAARFTNNRKRHLNFCKWITAISLVMIVVAAVMGLRLNFNGMLLYIVLPSVPIVVWFNGVHGCYGRGGAQLELMKFTGSEDDLGQDKKDMIQDGVFIYRESSYLVPRCFEKRRDRKE